MKRWGMVGAQLLGLVVINVAHAGGLGVQGDGFIAQFIGWLPTIGYMAMAVGILIWLQASSDYNQGVLAGSVGLLTRGMIGGGMLAILAAMGFSQGALLN